jgi:hypothetical protein
MIDYPISISESYVLINKVLNTLVRRKFGKQYSIRLNSLKFISNRADVFYLHNCIEKITLKTIRPVSLNELISIKDFLLFNINSALMCIDYKSYFEVVDIEITIL